MVGLMVIMFASFIIQIATRYVFNAPTEWTYEVILITWLWAVFWGAAFLLEDKDHVKFDIIYNTGGEKTRRKLALFSAIFLAAASSFRCRRPMSSSPSRPSAAATRCVSGSTSCSPST